MNTMGQVCTLAFLGTALRSLYILESPKPMVLAFFCKLVQLSSLLYPQKKKRKKICFFSLNEKRHWPIPLLHSKIGHKELRNVGNSNSNLQNTYTMPLMEIIFPGSFGVLQMLQLFQKETKASYKAYLEKISPLFKGYFFSDHL